MPGFIEGLRRFGEQVRNRAIAQAKTGGTYEPVQVPTAPQQRPSEACKIAGGAYYNDACHMLHTSVGIIPEATAQAIAAPPPRVEPVIATVPTPTGPVPAPRGVFPEPYAPAPAPVLGGLIDPQTLLIGGIAAAAIIFMGRKRT